MKVETKAEEAMASDNALTILISGTEASVMSFGEMIQAHLHSYAAIKQEENQQWCVDG